MFSILPDLTPRDSHTLWYSSPSNPQVPFPSNDATTASDANGQGNANGQQSRRRGHALERTPLHRLAADEFYMTRRRMNVANFGSHWLKPPGVAKTLHQMREEKREQEEHQEAMRREQLAQELADAEATGMPEDGAMDDVQLDGTQDLDDDIPEAADDFFMGDGDDDDDDEEEDDDDDEEDDEDEENAVREGRQVDLLAAGFRMRDDAFREALIRGGPNDDDLYGSSEELEEEDQGHLLEEDDFVQEDDMEGDMDANLDDDIPEADDGGYEHTDSEAELSSSSSDGGNGPSYAEQDEDDEDDLGANVGFAPRVAPLGPPLSPTLRGRTSVSTPGNSMELSGLLSQDESSFMQSSPAQGRRARHG